MLNKLKNENYKGKFGELRINLKWETYDDLDLHVYDPDSNHINYGKKEAACQNSIGRLDLDANAGSGTTKTPQENIYWEKEPPEGTYKVEVVHYASREKKEVPFILSVITLKGESKIFYGKVDFDSNKTVEVTKFKYKKELGVSFVT